MKPFYLGVLAALGLSAGSALGVDAPAEAQQTPPVNQCLEDAHFGDFDFWVGSWRVTANGSGAYAGDNVITKVENGCALEERWTSAGGGTGRSINYYNPQTEKWRQVWVAAPGYVIDIEGGLEDGSMVLVGTITTYGNKAVHPFKGTWTPNEDGTVRQFFEQYSEETKAWQPWFDGIYAPSE